MARRPVTIRKETWDWLEAALAAGAFDMGSSSITVEQLTAHILTAPGRYLLAVGITDHPDLLGDTVITLDDDVDCLIDLAAAQELAGGAGSISLTVLGGGDRVVSRAVVLAAVTGQTFDQLERG